MLVLSRKKSESIIIGDNVEIKIIDVGKDGKVRIGIEAPENITVLRKEIYDEVKAENLKAANGNADKLKELF